MQTMPLPSFVSTLADLVGDPIFDELTDDERRALPGAVLDYLRDRPRGEYAEGFRSVLYEAVSEGAIRGNRYFDDYETRIRLEGLKRFGTFAGRLCRSLRLDSTAPLSVLADALEDAGRDAERSALLALATVFGMPDVPEYSRPFIGYFSDDEREAILGEIEFIRRSRHPLPGFVYE